ncbi:MAG: Dihydrolipoyllysine-residue succinyltransferase component of 2-oxoglutarate dehydrogenase complex [Acidobacteria bacterium ADurb.Bin340]|nr:MAG: Dihydrolipoyllysine-residue succinyltransferase component of 2-oxoglutarate dehydrogenase complex [Acidobacteria bacterium ADurb.Bin340]HQL48252.1 dihydrolipoamide acetyltransferase family protein [Holophaga sp.]
MAFDVIMPQMGESIAEATILKWHRKVGEAIGKDETLYEISTDKVDAEIPAPLAGTLLEILVSENQTVPVGSVVARLGDANEKPVGAPPAAKAEETSAAPVSAAAPHAPVLDHDNSLEGRLAAKSSPLVRKMAETHGVDLQTVKGSGQHGRVTKSDLEAHLAQTPIKSLPQAEVPPAPTLPPASPAVPAPVPGERVRMEPMSRMRKIISDNMVASRRTSAHVYTVWEFDLTHVARLRRRNQKAFQEAYGVKLSFMPFVMAATAKALRAFPVVNAAVEGDHIAYKLDINLGVAVSLDWGLIVPVVRQADQLNLGGLARALNDLAERSRTKQLKPDEITGGTFTITNPGVFGDTFGLPIISQPQVAILGMGAIKKRPVVVTDEEGNDSIAIRETMFSGLSFDHRIIDGAVADQFMALIKKELETSDFGLA